MAIARTLIVKSNDALGNEYQKSITHVNPATTAAQIDTFARAFNNLSTNTYSDTIKRDEESINEALAE
ncbi:MAG: hypothetical protein IJT73_06495 [Selenomonadaceae bacterium]|nr:hypothetical protein [Selenomonadaceae bacterium]